MSVLYKDIIRELPAPYDGKFSLPAARSDHTIVILDDDPTGCQTVHDVAVSFSWEVNDLTMYLRENCRLLFILTNSRSMTAPEVEETFCGIMENLDEAKRKTGRDLIVISRSDSTLRGHYPLELNVISSFQAPGPFMHCLIPAFFSGGRYTIHDIHYVREDDVLIPAAETTFARDRVFGFRSSNLKEYIEEKQEGLIRSSQVLSFSIRELRQNGPKFVTQQLLSSDIPACIVNSADHTDLDVFAAGAWEAILKGKKILFRTAASFINSFAGIPEKEPLESSRLRSDGPGGGLVVVGSYVEKSSRQLKQLLDQSNVKSLEVNVDRLIFADPEEEIQRVSTRMNQLLHSGRNVVIFTSRELISAGKGEQNLDIGKRVSHSLVQVIKKLESVPSFLITKGGITSHEIAARGLEISRAKVIGQALPGVPVLETPGLPGMKYIIFPGNVGTDRSLLELYNKLKP